MKFWDLFVLKSLRFWFSVWEGEGGEGTPVKSYRIMSYGGWGCESCTHIQAHICMRARKHKELQLLELKFSFDIEGFLDFLILSEFKRHFACGNALKHKLLRSWGGTGSPGRAGEAYHYSSEPTHCWAWLQVLGNTEKTTGLPHCPLSLRVLCLWDKSTIASAPQDFKLSMP